MLIVFDQIMPFLGLSSVHGVFLIASNIATLGLFDAMESVFLIVSDCQDDRPITSYLTIPLSHSLFFLHIGLVSALKSLLVTIAFIPVAKVLFWNKFNIDNVSWVKLIIILLLSNIFYGFFSLFLASRVENVQKIENVWKRAIFPLWYFGCYMFSWQILKHYSLWVAYCVLLNPVVYCMEGTRVALFGQAGSINFWYCVIGLIVASIIVGYFAIKNMKKRLDCL